ncbi:Na+/galactose cotransporter, partial [Streptomyces sp. TRM76130]|nr:Na+/galactose cotransporter [Streptomyces sp. TRM76130]
PAAELRGLVYGTLPQARTDSSGGTPTPGMSEAPGEGDDAWYRKPALLGWGAVVLAAACYIPFSF